MQNVFVEYGLSEELMQAKKIALGDMEALEDGDIYEKVDALADVLGPITEDLASLTGKEFVKTMSEEAVEFYSEATAYWAKEGNLTAYNSVDWGTAIPRYSDPTNAVKCAAQKGKCECHTDSLVYYGLKTADGKLDSSANYAVAEADHSGYTFCKNQVFGDPLPGDKRKKYCFCDESVGMRDAKVARCAENGKDCRCEMGGSVIYGNPSSNGRTIDISQDHWEIEAPFNGTTKCEASNFGADLADGTCFCELPKPPKHNYCEVPDDDAINVGCYEDRQGNPDFEELVSGKDELVSIKECLGLAFEKHYIYAGLQKGGQCWGSSLQIGKYGSSSKCNYPCPDGKGTCGGKGANSVFKMDYAKDFLCNMT
jgi:hypothetical protein